MAASRAASLMGAGCVVFFLVAAAALAAGRRVKLRASKARMEKSFDLADARARSPASSCSVKDTLETVGSVAQMADRLKPVTQEKHRLKSVVHRSRKEFHPRSWAEVPCRQAKACGTKRAQAAHWRSAGHYCFAVPQGLITSSGYLVPDSISSAGAV